MKTKPLPNWIEDDVTLRDLAGSAETGYGKALIHAAKAHKAELEKQLVGGNLKAHPEKVKDTMEHIIGEMAAMDWIVARPSAAKTLLNKIETGGRGA